MRPPNRIEKRWAWIVVAAAVVFVPPMFGLPQPSEWIASPKPYGERYAGPFTPMPDLCARVPSGIAAKAVTDRRSLDRNESTCTFRGEGVRLELSVDRTVGRAASVGEARAKAVDAFKRQAGQGYGKPVDVPLGDEARATRAAADGDGAVLVVRKDLSVLSVTYLGPGDAAAVARRVAEELLPTIPAS